MGRRSRGGRLFEGREIVAQDLPEVRLAASRGGFGEGWGSLGGYRWGWLGAGFAHELK
jgi:hypothetical protein